MRPTIGKALNVINHLEGFAIFFNSGIAAEEVAFNSIGKTYCNSVTNLLPVIAIGAESRKHYQDVVKLYFLWKSRFDAERLIDDKEKIEERIKRIGGEIITPIGLEK